MLSVWIVIALAEEGAWGMGRLMSEYICAGWYHQRRKQLGLWVESALSVSV